MGTTAISFILALAIVLGLAPIPAAKAPLAEAATTGWSLQRSWQEPALYGVDFVDSSNGWAVGGGGAVLHTSNGGIDWSPQTSNTVYDLQAVDFVDTNHGWAVANGIWHTDDGGSTWTLQKPLTIITLYDVCFPDASNGWVVGGDGISGTILHTANGGADWETQTIPATANLYGVDFVSVAEGWAVGFGGTVLHTTDGGAHWNLRPSGFTDALNGVDFIDSQQGWAVGSGQKIWHTASGGTTWSQQYGYSGGPYLYDVAMIDVSTGWAVGQNGVILHTLDGGDYWFEQNNPAAPGHMNSLALIGSEAWAVGSFGFPASMGAVAHFPGYQAPSADFTADITSGQPPLEVHFSSTSTGDITSYLWDFGDGETSTEANPSHTYATAGNYTVSLTVTGPGGSDTETKTDLISVASPPGGAVVGRVHLQGCTDHQGIQIDLGGRQAATDAQGNFILTAVPPGDYVLAASKPGFLSAQRQLVRVAAGKVHRVLGTTLLGGDANSDSAIDLQDIALIGSHFNGSDSQADINGDGLVDIFDLVLIGKNYGQNGPARWPLGFLLKWAKLAEAAIDTGGTHDQHGALSPAVIKLPDETFRMYYSGFDGTYYRILSAVSPDGVTWTKEEGVRLDVWGSYDALIYPDVVTLPDGSYRMYFSARSTGGGYSDICSATSSDGLDWQVEPGIRIEHGGTFDSVLAQCPSVIKNDDATYYQFPDGKHRMYYAGFDGSHFRILSAWSEDGLAWSKEGVRLGFGAAFSLNHATTPKVIRLPDGSFRLFFARGDNLQSGALPQVTAQTGSFGSYFAIASATSFDAMQWILDQGLRLRGQNHTMTPEIVWVGGNCFMFYTGYNLMENPRILSALGLDAQNEEPLSNIQASTISVAEKEITFDFDFTDLPIFPQIVPEPYWTINLLKDGEPVAGFSYDPLPQPWPASGPLTGTASLDVVNNSGEIVLTDQIEVLLLNKLGEVCPFPLTCYPIFTDVYSEVLDCRILWLPTSGGQIDISRIEEKSPRGEAAPDGPYLNVRANYNYYQVDGLSAYVDVEVRGNQGSSLDGFEITPLLVDPGRGVINIPVKYTGLQSLDSYSLKATLRFGLYGTPFAEAPKLYPKAWNPLATGYLDPGVIIEQITPDKVVLSFNYLYSSRTGARGKVLAYVVESGIVQEQFQQEHPCPLQEGGGSAALTIEYNGSQMDFNADQIRLEMSTPESVIATRTYNTQSIAWNPTETGVVRVANPEQLVEPIPKGPQLRVPVVFIYNSPGATTGQVYVDILNDGQVRSSFSSEPVTVSPAEGVQQAVVAVDYTGSTEILTTDQVRARLVGVGGQLIDSHTISYDKTWKPDSEVEIVSFSASKVNDWMAEVSVTYDYASVIHENARIKATVWKLTWVIILPPDVGAWLKDDLRNFAHEPVLLEEGHHTTTFKLLYTGSSYDFDTNGIDLEAYIGDTETLVREGDTAAIEQALTWSAPPSGSLLVDEVSEVEGTGDRQIVVDVDYTCLTSEGDVATLQVDVLRNPEELAPGFGTPESRTVQIQSTSSVRSVDVPVEYSGDIPFYATSYVRVIMLVNGEPVMQDGEPLALDYEFSKEWYTDPPGIGSDPIITPLSPREVSLVVDFACPLDADLTPSVSLFRAGEDVTDRFVIDIQPSDIAAPTAGKIAARIWYTGLAELHTDEIEVRLKTAQGQTVLGHRFTTDLAWQEFGAESRRLAYDAQNLQITRLDEHTIDIAVDLTNPLDTSVPPAIPNTPIAVKPLLWVNNMPLLDKEAKTFPNQELFTYETISLGTTGSIPSTKHLEVAYAPPVGELDINAISLIFYDPLDQDQPLYSRTFSLAQPEHLVAPTAILDIQYTTTLIEGTGELLVSVTYSEPISVHPSYCIWVTPNGESESDFDPLVLSSPEVVACAGSGIHTAQFKFRMSDNYYWEHFAAWDDTERTFNGIDIEFNMRHLSEEPVSRMTLNASIDPWSQPANIKSPSTGHPMYIDHPYPSRIEIYNIDSSVKTPSLASTWEWG